MERIITNYTLILFIYLLMINVDNSIAATSKNDFFMKSFDSILTINDMSNNNSSSDKLTRMSEKKSIIQKTLNPLIPFGSITGKPTKDQLQKYLDSFRSVGIDQFLIYPRSGLEIEYMSEEWLDVCEFIIKYAKDHDMSIWLYDEFNWPSGSCKGQVFKQDEDFAGKKISVFSDPVNLGKRNYFWSVSSVPIYADLLNPKAVESYINLTHEKYYKRFKQYFGTVIKGFFTDEPSPMYAARHKTSGSLLELPYWNDLEEEYYQYTNRNFRLDVEAHLNGATPPTLWPNYFYLYGKRFKSAYFDHLRIWCDQHNVLFTGHLMDESWPSSSLLANGNPLSNINSFSMPGIDEVCTKTTPGTIEWVTMKLAENAASKKGNGAFAELFALGPCDMTLGKRRQMIWITALHGVDHFLLAISPIDSRANIQKPDYYNPHTITQPWFNVLKELGEDAKEAALFARKIADPKIAVRYPQNLTASTMFFSKKDQPLLSLSLILEKLISWQWDPNLIAEEEIKTSGYKAILSLTKTGIVEERSGNKFSSLEELSSWLGNNIQRDALVENSNGKLVEDIFVKTFEDGSICVVSLSDTTHGQLVLKQSGVKPVLFELPESGVFAYHPGKSYKYKKVEKVLMLSDKERLPYKLTSHNIERIVFDKTNKFEFTLDGSLDDLKVDVRNYDDTVSVELDGKELKVNQTSQLLPEGLKELYIESDRFSLGAGKHALKLTSNSKDYPFFPVAFICGNFSMKSNNVLWALPVDLSIDGFAEQGLPDYIGGITFRKKVMINNEEYISVDTKGLAAEIFINGLSLGRKAWAPFRWEIPQKFRNKKINLEIRIWTSVGPLFGDYPRMAGPDGSLLKRFAPK